MKTIRSLVKDLTNVKRAIRVNQLEGEDLLSFLEKEGRILLQLEEYLDELLGVRQTG